MNFIILLFSLFVVVGLLLSIVFFTKVKGDKVSNRLLSLYTFLFSFELLNNVLRWSGALNIEGFVHFSLLHFPLWTLYGPILYVYIRRITTGELFKKLDFLMLIPSSVIIIKLAPFYILGNQEKLNLVNNGAQLSYVNWPNYGIWVIIAILFFYSFLCYFSFKKNKKIGYRENQWLKWIVGSYTGFVVLFTTYIVLISTGTMNPSYDYFVDIVIVFFIGLLSFFGFFQPDVFAGKSIRDVIPFIKYKKTGLSKKLSMDMREKLVELMLHQKPYLDNELRLDDLAMLMNLSRNQTSQIINEHFNLTFFDFINRYRIMEAKNMLIDFDNQRLTMAQLAYEVGFNNRASFYKAFKKFTKSNPSSYLEKTKIS